MQVITLMVALVPQISICQWDMLMPDVKSALIRLSEDSDCEIVVTSGYRNPTHNAKVGGSKRSYHLLGRAVDMYSPNCPKSLLKEELQKSAQRLDITLKELLYYKKTGHTHLAL